MLKVFDFLMYLQKVIKIINNFEYNYNIGIVLIFLYQKKTKCLFKTIAF